MTTEPTYYGVHQHPNPDGIRSEVVRILGELGGWGRFPRSLTAVQSKQQVDRWEISIGDCYIGYIEQRHGGWTAGAPGLPGSQAVVANDQPTKTAALTCLLDYVWIES